MRDFRKLKTWQAAYSLTLEVYRLTEKLPTSERYGLSSQLRRATVSVGANIVEGSTRETDASLRHFLSIAQGSAAELEYLLILACDLGYLDSEATDRAASKTRDVRRMLSGFARKLPARRTANS